jgi:hypothetical protein
MWFEVGFCPFTPVWPTGARRSCRAGGGSSTERPGRRELSGYAGFWQTCSITVIG